MSDDNSAPEAALPWEPVIQSFEQWDRQHPPLIRETLLVGSSSVGMWPTPEADFAPIPLVRRGFGGSTMADLLYYYDRVVMPYRPRAIIVYEGDNDVGNGKSPIEVLAEFQTFVNRVRATLGDAKIYFIALKPSPCREPMFPAFRQTNRLLAELAVRTQGVMFINIWDAMLNADGSPRKELYLEDMLHMNAKGYELWTSIIKPIVAKGGL